MRTPVSATLCVVGLACLAPAANAQPTAEDGLAIIRSKATLSDAAKLRVRVACIALPAKVPCSGDFRLTTEDKKLIFAEGSFTRIENGSAKVMTISVNPEARTYMRRRCSFALRAVVYERDGSSISDLDQRPVRVTRTSADCRRGKRQA